MPELAIKGMEQLQMFRLNVAADVKNVALQVPKNTDNTHAGS